MPPIIRQTCRNMVGPSSVRCSGDPDDLPQGLAEQLSDPLLALDQCQIARSRPGGINIGCRRQPTRMHLCPTLPPYGPALTFQNRPNLKQNLMGSTVCVPTSQQCRPLPSRHFCTSAQSAQHGCYSFEGYQRSKCNAFYFCPRRFDRPLCFCQRCNGASLRSASLPTARCHRSPWPGRPPRVVQVSRLFAHISRAG